MTEKESQEWGERRRGRVCVCVRIVSVVLVRRAPAEGKLTYSMTALSPPLKLHKRESSKVWRLAPPARVEHGMDG